MKKQKNENIYKKENQLDENNLLSDLLGAVDYIKHPQKFG